MTMTREGILKHKKEFDAWLDGAEIEQHFCADDGYPEPGWFVTADPSFTEASVLRIKHTPDSINWDHVKPDLKYLVRDKVGRSWLLKSKPMTSEDDRVGWVNSNPTDGLNFHSASSFISLTQGTCDWKESLVGRP